MTHWKGGGTQTLTFQETKQTQAVYDTAGETEHRVLLLLLLVVPRYHAMSQESRPTLAASPNLWFHMYVSFSAGTANIFKVSTLDGPLVPHKNASSLPQKILAHFIRRGRIKRWNNYSSSRLQRSSRRRRPLSSFTAQAKISRRKPLTPVSPPLPSSSCLLYTSPSPRD